jgi:peptide/nickel transport system substrate-binding protein
MRVAGATKRSICAVILAVVIAAALSACGSGGGTQNTPSGGSSNGLKIKQTGVGLTQPTSGSGQRIKGGTAYYAEGADSPPNYIFPMYSPEYCGNSNIFGVISMAYRPVYWFGNHYSPTIDYDYSLGKKPVYSDGGKVVTIHLNHYMWSDGEQVSARDLVFWMNIMKQDPGRDWCGYAPGKFPDNVVSYKAVNPTTFQLTFNKSYNPDWLLYEELSQLTPIPMAWDKTSMSQPAPNPNASNLPDTTKAGANKVWNFLNTEGQKINSWGSSPIWSIVDGPWKVQSTTSNGGVTFVPNTHFSGSPKPSLSKFVEVPFTSESALVNELKSEGTKALTVSYIPSQYQPLSSQLESEGYDLNLGSTYGLSFFPLNLNAPTVGKVFRQLYFRQAFQHLVDQPGWISHFLHGAAIPTYGPAPLAPPSTLVDPASESDVFPFSVSDASKLMKAHGWHVVPGGSSTCAKPGTASDECGAGITKGEGITFNLDYASNTASVQEEMQDLQSQAAKVGIKITLTTHPTDDVISAEIHCSAGQPGCKWDAEYVGGYSWTYQYYPAGDNLFYSGSFGNTSNYSNKKMDRLIDASLTASPSQGKATMAAFLRYTEQQVPLVWTPTPIGAFCQPGAGTLVSKKLGGFQVNANGAFTPEQWYLTK